MTCVYLAASPFQADQSSTPNYKEPPPRCRKQAFISWKLRRLGDARRPVTTLRSFSNHTPLIFAEPSLKPALPLVSLVCALPLQHRGPACTIGGRRTIGLTQLDGRRFLRNRRRRTVAILAIVAVLTVKVVRAMRRLDGISALVLSRRILLEYCSSAEALESILLSGVWPGYGRRAFKRAIVTAGLGVRVTVAAIRSIGVYRVSRLLIAVARIYTVATLAVAVPSWIRLHAVVSRPWRPADWATHTVGIEIAVTITSAATVVAADLGVAVLVVAWTC
jgi:hypothetical protein